MDGIRCALENGASIHAKDRHGWTALHLAAYHCHTLAVKYLCSQGASIYKRDDDGWNVLQTAAFGGNVDIVKHILDQDRAAIGRAFQGNILFQKSSYNATLLHLAARNRSGGAKIIKFLCQRAPRLDLNAKDLSGDTPMHRAALEGYADNIKELLRQKAKIDEKNNEGNTPLCEAAINSHLKAAKTLCDAGADINVKNKKDKTPYEIALSEHLRWREKKSDSKESLAYGTKKACETMEFLRDHPTRKKDHPIRKKDHPIRKKDHPIRKKDHPIRKKDHPTRRVGDVLRKYCEVALDMLAMLGLGALLVILTFISYARACVLFVFRPWLEGRYAGTMHNPYNRW